MRWILEADSSVLRGSLVSLNDEQNGRICPKRRSNINKKDAQTYRLDISFIRTERDDTRTYPQMILSISYVRDGDGMQEPCVRSVWTYARGSRACYGACAQMVEMFSSLYLFFIFSCISFVSEYSFHKTDCKGSLFPSIHQSFLLFMQHFFAVAGNSGHTDRHLRMSMTIFSAKNSSWSTDEIGQTPTEPFGRRNLPIARAISSTRSPPFR